VPAVLPGYRTRTPRLLDLDMPATGKDAFDPAATRLADGRSYAPVRVQPDLFKREPHGGRHLQVAPAESLRRRGFHVQRVPDRLLARGGENGWQVQAYVEIADDGRVEHVFIESGTDNAALNRDVIGMLQRGRVTEAGPRCSGRVVVSLVD
jgi:hypothetical protein